MTYANNKWGKYQFMQRIPALTAYLPFTQRATKDNIRHMASAYPAIYLKPNHGTGGFGVMKLIKQDRHYVLKSGKTTRTFSDYDHFYAYFSSMIGRRSYLVQKGIRLLQHRNRPFDIRVMVQKGGPHWKATGIVGRLARPGKVVTNYHSGGTPLPIESLLRPQLQPQTDAYIGKLMRLGVAISRYMHKGFPRYRAFGIDIAVDEQRHPWVLEVNSRPDKFIFRALQDKTMFRRIMRYGRK